MLIASIYCLTMMEHPKTKQQGSQKEMDEALVIIVVITTTVLKVQQDKSATATASIIVQHHYHDHANDNRAKYQEEEHPARGGVTTPFPLKFHERAMSCVDELLSTSFFEEFNFPDHIGAEIEDDAVFSNMLEEMIA
jgi:hypothetical protein